MKSYQEWLAKEHKGYEEEKSDGRGGLIPSDLAKAKKVDLITLPESVQGTNCGNCKWFKAGDEKKDDGYCRHREVKMEVTKRMCCALWDNSGVKRPWKSND